MTCIWWGGSAGLDAGPDSNYTDGMVVFGALRGVLNTLGPRDSYWWE
jgi:hypothetical protein